MLWYDFRGLEQQRGNRRPNAFQKALYLLIYFILPYFFICAVLGIRPDLQHAGQINTLQFQLLIFSPISLSCEPWLTPLTMVTFLPEDTFVYMSVVSTPTPPPVFVTVVLFWLVHTQMIKSLGQVF